MALVRRHRALLVGALYGIVSVCVLWLALGARSSVAYVPSLPAFPDGTPGTRSYYTRGFTEWLVVQERSTTTMRAGAAQVERRRTLDPEGVAEGVIVLLGLGLVGFAACPRAVAVMRLRGRCDECGYDLEALTAARCPECGHPVGAPARNACA